MANVYKKVTLLNANTGFQSLVTPDDYRGNIRYSLQFLFDKKDENLKAINNAVVAVAKEAFGDDYQASIEADILKMPVKTNEYALRCKRFVAKKLGTMEEAQAKYNYLKDKVLVTAKSSKPPVVYFPKGDVGSLTAPFGLVVNASVSVGSYSGENQGVTVYLNAVNIISAPESDSTDYATELGVTDSDILTTTVTIDNSLKEDVSHDEDDVFF